MTSSVADLLSMETRSEILQSFLTELADKGWPVTDWEDGNPGLTLLEVIARSHGDFARVVKDITEGGLLDTASGDWLTLLAASFYQITRKAAQSAVVRATLTCSASAGPYSINAGASRLITSTGLRYTSTNTGTETLATGSTLVLEYKAESPGVSYNLSLAATVSLVTTLPGVTVVVTEIGSTGSPMVTQGTNQETDAQLRERCRGRWATLGAEKTKDAYAFLATSIADLDPDIAAATPGVSTVNRVLVDDTNPDGPGTIDIYLAGDSGGISTSAIVTAVDGFLQDRRGLCSALTTQGATNDTVTIHATVKVAAAQMAAAKQAVSDALTEYQATLQIGDGTSKGIVYRSQIVEILMAPEGVVNVPLSSVLLATLASDYTPAKGHIAVLSYSVSGGSPTIVFDPI